MLNIKKNRGLNVFKDNEWCQTTYVLKRTEEYQLNSNNGTSCLGNGTTNYLLIRFENTCFFLNCFAVSIVDVVGVSYLVTM